MFPFDFLRFHREMLPQDRALLDALTARLLGVQGDHPKAWADVIAHASPSLFREECRILAQYAITSVAAQSQQTRMSASSQMLASIGENELHLAQNIGFEDGEKNTPGGISKYQRTTDIVALRRNALNAAIGKIRR